MIRPFRSIAAVAAVTAVALVATPRLGAQWFGAGRPAVSEAHVRSHMEFLASDAIAGRRSGSRDEWIAAEYVAASLRRLGLEPLGDLGTFVQSVPPPGTVTTATRTWNVLARLPGRHPTRRGQVIVLSAHLDHVGTRGTGGDTVFNGADDNASGVTAVLELARVLAQRRLDRTIVFAWFGAEESGGAGSRHFLDDPVVPLDDIVADLQFEMIGRPDPMVPKGTLWLTGFERSTLGPALAERGAHLVADPRPEERFFVRSDNIAFAYRGIVAHTVSSFGMHRDYHAPGDDVAKIDFAHMTTAIQMLVEPIEWLARTDFRPTWNPNGRPEPPSRQGR